MECFVGMRVHLSFDAAPRSRQFERKVCQPFVIYLIAEGRSFVQGVCNAIHDWARRGSSPKRSALALSSPTIAEDMECGGQNSSRHMNLLVPSPYSVWPE